MEFSRVTRPRSVEATVPMKDSADAEGIVPTSAVPCPRRPAQTVPSASSISSISPGPARNPQN